MSKKKINYIITDSNITVNYEGQTHIVSRTDGLADKLIDALRNQREDDIPNLISTAKRIENFSHGKFVVKDGEILVNGVVVPRVLGNKIVKFANEGLPHQPLVKFAENLQKNPSYRAVNELFQFLEKNDHPITENGCFIAYKKVRSNFKDIHSGLFDNSPGTVVEIARNQVDEDSARTCSRGLHVANWDYANNHYGTSEDVMLEVEVNPADVVAIPSDYNQSKMRVCKYLVLGVVDREHSSDVSYRVVNQDVADSYESDNHCDSACDSCHYGDSDDEEDRCEYCDCSDCDGSCEEEDYCPSCDDVGCEDCDKYPWEDEIDEEA